MRNAHVPWELLRGLHLRRADASKKQWLEAKQALEVHKQHLQAAIKRRADAQQQAQQMIDDIDQQKMAHKISIENILTLQRCFESLKRQTVELDKEVQHCQTVCDNQLLVVEKCLQNMHRHERLADTYKQRHKEVVRAGEHALEERQDEEAIEVLSARKLSQALA